MMLNDKDINEPPDLGNYNEYSPKLKEILKAAETDNENKGSAVYKRLKTAILARDITVNTVYLPVNAQVFSIMFHNKFLSETVIRAVVGEEIIITDPLVEHRNDILKAIENSIRVDVFFSLPM